MNNKFYSFCLHPLLLPLTVVKQNDANLQKLGEIDIPGRSCSTPVEDLDNLMEDIGISWPRNELTSVNVTLFERTLDLKGKILAKIDKTERVSLINKNQIFKYMV